MGAALGAALGAFSALLAALGSFTAALAAVFEVFAAAAPLGAGAFAFGEAAFGAVPGEAASGAALVLLVCSDLPAT